MCNVVVPYLYLSYSATYSLAGARWEFEEQRSKAQKIHSLNEAAAERSQLHTIGCTFE